MEEELSDNELEARMYAMIHYVDDTQKNVGTKSNEDNIFEKAPRSTIHRYWRTNCDLNNIYKKVNNHEDPIVNKNSNEQDLTQGKDQQKDTQEPPPDISLFQKTVPDDVKKTVEIVEHEIENHVVELETSDEDEVILVALPPKPTITIESSDEDDIAVTTGIPCKKNLNKPAHEKPTERQVTSSPVPSVVSSVSDDFIRSDCIALNISSKHPNNKSFDFSLHGSDLLDQTPSKKKKKKKSKDATSTPISTPMSNMSNDKSFEECFATPKSKAKNKKQKTKSYQVSEKSVPNPDVYDSDSNQSIIDNNKNYSSYSVTEKSLPNTDVYESDSNQSEICKETRKKDNLQQDDVSSYCSIVDVPTSEIPETNKNYIKESNKTLTVDLTEPGIGIETINENIIIGNVTGFTEMDDYSDEHTAPQCNISKCGSTKIPAILSADLDFDNLKGIDKVCKRRCYSLATLRAEMEKFYNESWGGEDFNHREIQKNMSRDKNLWVIDPKDRMPNMVKRKITCNYCNRTGHRDETCRMKPPVCFMCGSTGHFETRCPKKICVNCGSPNHIYSSMCRNCYNWNCIRCAECGQNGHPASHCPDVWRRYHNTINLDNPLEETRELKKSYQMFCSGCTRRGHLVHTCRNTLPFSGLPVNSPYVSVYQPVYRRMTKNNENQPNHEQHEKIKYISDGKVPYNQRLEQLKRLSKSPVIHDSHMTKKRNLGPETSETSRKGKTQCNIVQRKSSQSKDQGVPKDTQDLTKSGKRVSESQDTEKAPDFIAITSDNRDKKGQIIQDNEVSDTSEVITSARIFVTKNVVEKLKTEEGQTWVTDTLNMNNVALENRDITFFLSVKGTVSNQEAFQTALREWIGNNHQIKTQTVSESEGDVTQESIHNMNSPSDNIPKNRNNVLRKLGRALESLKKNFGEPQDLYKELLFLQKRHQQLLRQKVISPKQLSNNKDNINTMLKKLNMVLLGQAGLADGSKHLSELHLLQNRLTNSRQKNIPPSLREEIGEHFHCIFAAMPRDDYADLLSKYYKAKQTLKKKIDKVTKTPKKTFNTKFPNKAMKDVMNVASEEPLREITKNKLVLYHKRLMYIKPNDAALKRTKNNLLQKLYFNIGLMDTRAHISPKVLKKIKKVQEQAQLFLTHV